jgi:uncharacterized protein YndB with AHSA1/START domain
MDIDKLYHLPFSPATVYAAWVSSETVIAPATRMEIDPIVGGHYRLFIETPEMTMRNFGTFLLVEPHARLCYTWEWNKDGEVSEIDVTFAPAGSGTDVHLRHTGFTKPESRVAHDRGWDSYIDGLSAFLKFRHTL